MKLKKVIAVIVVLAVTVGAVTGGIYGYKSYQKKNLVAEVQSVSSLNYGYYGNSETSYGVVTNDSSQEVYLDDSNKVQEVYVSKGDTVKEGDPLIQYDTSEAEIDPKILLADEPTGALDSKSGEQIMELFQKLNEEGVTIVMITHDPHIASNAKRMVKIIDGEIFEGDEKEDAS